MHHVKAIVFQIGRTQAVQSWKNKKPQSK